MPRAAREQAAIAHTEGMHYERAPQKQQPKGDNRQRFRGAMNFKKSGISANVCMFVNALLVYSDVEVARGGSLVQRAVVGAGMRHVCL